MAIENFKDFTFGFVPRGARIDENNPENSTIYFTGYFETGATMGSCQKLLENLFLKHGLENDAIRAFEFSKEMRGEPKRPVVRVTYGFAPEHQPALKRMKDELQLLHMREARRKMGLATVFGPVYG